MKRWEAHSSKLLSTFEGHQDMVRSVAFDPPGGMLASGSDDKTVKRWEAHSSKLLRTLERHAGAVYIVTLFKRAAAGLEK